MDLPSYKMVDLPIVFLYVYQRVTGASSPKPLHLQSGLCRNAAPICDGCVDLVDVWVDFWVLPGSCSTQKMMAKKTGKRWKSGEKMVIQASNLGDL